jgi:hypothetical protein
MNRSVIATACLLVVGGGALLLLVPGTWFRSPPAAVALLLVIVGAAAAAAALRRMATRWPAVVVLGYSAVFGLLMIASGAPLEGDPGPTPWRDEAIALGGPQVLVGLAWLVAGGIGVLVLARLSEDESS